MWKPSMLICCLCCWSIALQAQDPSFSQFYANRVYLNPAYAGFDPGYTLTLNYRSQWLGIPRGQSPLKNGFRTTNATVDWMLPCLPSSPRTNFGTALSVLSDAAGDGPLRTTGASAAFSLLINWTESRRASGGGNRDLLESRIGFDLGLFQRRLDAGYLLFSENLHPVDGIVLNPDNVNLRTNWITNLSAGLLTRYYHNDSDTQFTLGFAMANIIEPEIGFLGVDEASFLPRRITIHGGFFKPTGKPRNNLEAQFYIGPQAKLDLQAGLSQLTLGSFFYSKSFYAGLFYQSNLGSAADKTADLMATPLFRNTNTLIMSLGFDAQSFLSYRKNREHQEQGFIIGVSYGANLGGLNNTTTRGSLELNLRINLNYEQARKKNCFGSNKENYLQRHGGKCVSF